MTQEQKAEQAWSDYTYSFNAITAIHEFKSSLKREIEKRIEELEISIESCTYAPEKTILIGRKHECYNNLKLLTTVEP